MAYIRAAWSNIAGVDGHGHARGLHGRGGMPEYVVDGKTGFIVPPNDSAAIKASIRRILDDPALGRRMGRAGHQHVQQYSWQAVAARVYNEYERLLGRS